MQLQNLNYVRMCVCKYNIFFMWYTFFKFYFILVTLKMSTYTNQSDQVIVIPNNKKKI